jgi:hypothetical protein
MRRKCGLSSDERLIKELLAAGCPMPLKVEQEPQRDLIIEVSRPDVTIAYEMRAGAEYVFGVRIKNRSYSGLVLQGFECRLPWPVRVSFLSDPRVYTPQCETYRLESGRKFPFEDVLNHRVRENGTVEAGDNFEGVLLGYTLFGRIPPEYLNRDMALAELSVVDQYDRRHSSELELMIHRTATRRATVPRPRGDSLFGGRKSQERQTLRWIRPSEQNVGAKKGASTTRVEIQESLRPAPQGSLVLGNRSVPN